MTRQLSPSLPSFKLFTSRRSSTERSSAKRRIASTSVSFKKLWRSSPDVSARSPMVGAAKAPDARSLFATIDTDTLTSKEIEAIVVVSMTITMATTAAPPTEHRNATMMNARLAMGIALETISLENRNPWLAARKTAGVSPPRAKCTATRVARQSTVGPNVWRTRPTKKSRQRSAQKRTTLTTSAALQATPGASATIAQCGRATSPATSTTIAWITPTMETTSPSPFWPRLASKPSARHYLPKRSLPLQCLSQTMAPTTTQHRPNLLSWRHRTPQLPRWGRNAAVPRALNGTP
jgi:hypothetical protein